MNALFCFPFTCHLLQNQPPLHITLCLIVNHSSPHPTQPHSLLTVSKNKVLRFPPCFLEVFILSCPWMVMSSRRPPEAFLQALLDKEGCSTPSWMPQLTVALLPAVVPVSPPGSIRRSCANMGCNSMVPSVSYGPHYICITCRGCFTKKSRCEECETWNSAVVKHAQKYQGKLQVRQALNARPSIQELLALLGELHVGVRVCWETIAMNMGVNRWHWFYL